ncbi:lipoprotein-releasing ABC transporter permease subunit LolE [Catenovulum sediminis]|uniref:Lipoprotein-releasing ABC transporter permease subunit LolE n=1 Tax=Catenovulum sediminis TaxID=1740262 RepID=A0ABV1RKW9_9ALTE
MFDALTSQIGYRYARSRNKNAFIRFISASSVSGIALGCCVLIWVLSAMNGFEAELKNRLLSIVPHIEYIAVEPSGIEDWQSIRAQLMARQEIEGVAPFISFGALIQQADKLKPLEIRGIDWQAEKSVSSLHHYVNDEVAARFNSQEGLLLGKGLAESLQLEIGDWVEILVPKTGETKQFSAPTLIRVPLLGYFESGGQLDHLVGYMSLHKAAKESGWQSGVQGIRLKIDDVFAAPKIAREIGFSLPVYVYIQDWTRQFGHVYNDIQLVRGVMYLILALVIAVACFNIVSTLVMAVNEKRSDIAIYKTMGMTNTKIVNIFVVQGVVSGLIGTTIGVVFGILGAWYLSDVLVLIETMLGVQFLSSDIYFIDFLPTELHWSDVLITASAAMIMSLLATIYPALKASSVEPAGVVGHT